MSRLNHLCSVYQSDVALRRCAAAFRSSPRREMGLGWSKREMSVTLRVQPNRRACVARSQSVATFGDRLVIVPASAGQTVLSKGRGTARGASRMFASGGRTTNSSPRLPQPRRVDAVYTAFKAGLSDFLRMHHSELENLSGQQKIMKRNSRLGFLYDLDKQIKSTERFIRRLEFHISKIEELYETYGIHHRLQDGARKMMTAYEESPGSREARDTLLEVTKGYRDYTENLVVIENELEGLLGEFHIRMKGLIGYARLCPGDQYEVFMRYGRQRWRMKGRIDSDEKQSWDVDESILMPLISDLLAIKVTELKSLANHVLVGSVVCETNDLFTPGPQLVAVDVNDLGTLKLNLEVTWNPFEEEQTATPSTMGRSSMVGKRLSLYGLTPPDTPSLREQAFYKMLRQHQEAENGFFMAETEMSNDLGGLSAKLPHQKPVESCLSVDANKELQDVTNGQRQVIVGNAKPEAMELPRVESEELLNLKENFAQDADIGSPLPHCVRPVLVNGSSRFSRSLSQISEVSGDSFRESEMTCTTEEFPQDTKLAPCVEHPSNAHFADTNTTAFPSSPNRTTDFVELSTEFRTPFGQTSSPKIVKDEQRGKDAENVECKTSSREQASISPSSPTKSTDSKVMQVTMFANAKVFGEARPSSSGLSEAWHASSLLMQKCHGKYNGLLDFEEAVNELETLLQTEDAGSSLLHSRHASSLSLTVQHALESFSFLHEAVDGESGEDGRLPSPATALDYQQAPRDDIMPDDCRESDEEVRVVTTGDSNLDRALAHHLHSSSHCLPAIGAPGPLRCRELHALEWLKQQASVIRRVCELMRNRLKVVGLQSANVVPTMAIRVGLLDLWQKVAEPNNPYWAPLDALLFALPTLPTAKLRQMDSVRQLFAELLLNWQRRQNASTEDQPRIITIFSLAALAEKRNITSLDAFLVHLLNQVSLTESLVSCDGDTVLQALKNVPSTVNELEPCTWQALALLLLDRNGKIEQSAAAAMNNATAGPELRKKAVLWSLSLLEDDREEVQQAGCVALASLQVKESVEPLLYMCQSHSQGVCDAARNALLSLGPEGRDAYSRLDEPSYSLPCFLGPVYQTSTAF
uniref:rho family-interacting cell polarization regulator 1-like isoform X1 n=2 Tax=Myxine glutinosa TaxID=7769 RepID=UPI00358F7A0D